MTLIRVATGEAWNSVMDDMGRPFAPNFICIKPEELVAEYTWENY
jgi:hypothetical protein